MIEFMVGLGLGFVVTTIIAVLCYDDNWDWP